MCVVGLSSSVLIAMASSPAVNKKTKTAKKYWMPTTLWSVEKRR